MHKAVFTAWLYNEESEIVITFHEKFSKFVIYSILQFIEKNDVQLTLNICLDELMSSKSNDSKVHLEDETIATQIIDNEEEVKNEIEMTKDINNNTNEIPKLDVRSNNNNQNMFSNINKSNKKGSYQMNPKSFTTAKILAESRKIEIQRSSAQNQQRFAPYYIPKGKICKNEKDAQKFWATRKQKEEMNKSQWHQIKHLDFMIIPKYGIYSAKKVAVILTKAVYKKTHLTAQDGYFDACIVVILKLKNAVMNMEKFDTSKNAKIVIAELTKVLHDHCNLDLILHKCLFLAWKRKENWFGNDRITLMIQPVPSLRLVLIGAIITLVETNYLWNDYYAYVTLTYGQAMQYPELWNDANLEIFSLQEIYYAMIGAVGYQNQDYPKRAIKKRKTDRESDELPDRSELMTQTDNYFNYEQRIVSRQEVQQRTMQDF